MKLLHDIIVLLLAITAGATTFWIMLVASISHAQDRERNRKRRRAKYLEDRIVSQAMTGLRKREGKYDGERILVESDQTETKD